MTVSSFRLPLLMAGPQGAGRPVAHPIAAPRGLASVALGGLFRLLSSDWCPRSAGHR